MARFEVYSFEHRSPDGELEDIPQETEEVSLEERKKRLERDAEIIPHPAFLVVRNRIIQRAQEIRKQLNEEWESSRQVRPEEFDGAGGNKKKRPPLFPGIKIDELGKILNECPEFLEVERDLHEYQREHGIWMNGDCFQKERGGVEGQYCGHSEGPDGEVIHNPFQPSGDSVLLERSVTLEGCQKTRVRIADAHGHGPTAAHLSRLFTVFEAAVERRSMPHPLKTFDRYVESLLEDFGDPDAVEVLDTPQVSVLDVSVERDEEKQELRLSIKKAGMGFVFWIEEHDGDLVLRSIDDRSLRGERVNPIDLGAAAGFEPGAGIYWSLDKAHFSLPIDTRVVCMSDGLLDAVNRETGKSLKEELVALFNGLADELKGKPRRVIEQEFLSLLKKYHDLTNKRIEQTDDVTHVEL